MKKYIRILSLILSIILSVSLFTACKSNNDDESKVGQPIVLCDFEQWQPDFATIKFQKLFGKVRRNNDKNYVKSGDYSAKLMPVGGRIDRSYPVCWFPTTSIDYDYKYVDFTYADTVTAWIYNDNDLAKNITVGLVAEYTGFEKIVQLFGQTFYLEPKQWTLVNFVVDFNQMNCMTEVKESYIKAIQGVYYSFDCAMSPDPDLAPVFYIDDITINYKEEKNELKSTTLFAPIENNKAMMFDFEKEIEKHVIKYRIVNDCALPLRRVLTSQEAGVQATSNNNLFEMKFPLYPSSTGYASNGVTLDIPQEYTKQFWQTYVYNSEKENPYIIPRDDWDDWYFCIDIYNASPIDYDLGLRFTKWGGIWYTITFTTHMPRNEWVTLKVSVDDIASLRNCASGTYNGLTPEQYYLNEERITNPGKIVLDWNPVPKKEDNSDLVNETTYMKYYIDNVRIEKIV